MKQSLFAGLLVMISLALTDSIIAAERKILEAIQSGDLELSSKVALPEKRGDAAAAPGDLLERQRSQNLLYAITRVEENNINNKAYPLKAAKWPFNVVFICWENPTSANQKGRQLVRKAVAETWEKHSALEFIGWQPCTNEFAGIRIVIKDEKNNGPHVKYLGKFLAYDLDGRSRILKNGMLLNFTFDNWGQSCKSRVDYCIYAIGVHEFGHAIGFAHEQNRPDTPGECIDPPQGTSGDDTLLTPWDLHSVMNYCNPKYSNDGKLSAFDIKAVKYIYGGG